MYKYFIFPILMCTPLVSFAAVFSKTEKILTSIGGIVNYLTLLAVACALLFFFWGLAVFILRVGGDEQAVTEGKQKMFWGTIALFVIVSIWGIISFIEGELLGSSNSTPTPPRNSVPAQIPAPNPAQDNTQRSNIYEM